MPGGNQVAAWDDPNFERTPYKGGFSIVHSTGVAGNEALVLKLAPELKPAGIEIFGVNPGLLQTGIRKSVVTPNGPRGMSFFESVFEWIIARGFINDPSVENHAEALARWAFAPAGATSAHTGAMIDFKGRVILPSPNLVEGDKYLAFMSTLEKVLKDKAGV